MATKSLEYILAEYPDQRVKIMHLYQNNEDFRILCEDYLSIAMTIRQERIKEIKEKETKMEFVQVFLDLQKEMIHLLENNK